MTDPDLDRQFARLRAAPAPAPSEGAEERAVRLATAAFDENSRTRAKGTAAGRRQTSASPSRAWRFVMQNRMAIGGVAACLIAAPLAAVLYAEREGFSPLVVQPQRQDQNISATESRISVSPEERKAKKDAEDAATRRLRQEPAAARPAPSRNVQAPPAQPATNSNNSPAGGTAGLARPAPLPESYADQTHPSEARTPETAPKGKWRSDMTTDEKRIWWEQSGGAGLSRGAPLPGARAVESDAFPPPAPPATVGVRPAPEVGALAMRQAEDRDRFENKASNGVKVTANEPVSTFSIDADTASYSWVRRSLKEGRLPAPDQVRTEELVNYFPYDYPKPESADAPFRPTVAVFQTPWNAGTKLVHIGIKGFDPTPAARPKANLVFLIDTSGSMNEPDKLPLVKSSLKLLLGKLAPDDHVAIVTYAGQAGVALEPTRASDKDAIKAAIDKLGAGGSTAGAAGIAEAYRLAKKNFDPKGVNRVLLATDGDFNVGMSDNDGLQRMIEDERKSGVFLSVLGFGQGNYNDALMQRLAQNGNGSAAYIDELDEAQKTLVEEAGSTLFPIAKDAKIQVEFNPAQVSEYRLVGYETRMLNREDFNDDKVDAGEVGSGSAVTALYEIVPAGSKARLTDDLRYAAPSAAAPQGPATAEYGFLKIRYKLPNEDKSRLIEQPIGKAQESDPARASDDVRFASAVAAFGQKLKGDRRLDAMGWDEIAALADGARGADRWGYRAGFVRLIGLAKSLSKE